MSETDKKKEKLLKHALEPTALYLAEEQVDKLLAKGMVRHTERENLIQKEKGFQLHRLEDSLQDSSKKMGEGFLKLQEIALQIRDSDKERRALSEIKNAIEEMSQFSKDFLEKMERGESLDSEFLQEKLGGGFSFSEDAFIDLYEVVSSLYEEGAYKEAFSALTALCFIKPSAFNLWIARGMAAFRCEQYDDALASYSALKEMYPEDPKPYPYLIDVLIAQNEIEKAKKELYEFESLVHRLGKEEEWKTSLANIHRFLEKKR